MKNRKEWGKYSPKDQSNSTQIDTSQSGLMKTSGSLNPSLNSNSNLKSAESEDIDFHNILLPI